MNKLWPKKLISKKDSTGSKPLRSSDTKIPSKKSVGEVRRKSSKTEESQSGKLRAIPEVVFKRRGPGRSSSEAKIRIGAKSSRESALVGKRRSLHELTNVSDVHLSERKTDRISVSEPRFSLTQRIRSSLGWKTDYFDEQCKQEETIGSRIG